ncbi:MAG: hypothetical protein R3B46_05130 [Phycisphaerales bacterium]|nr:hypothetical protein [Phycisphaerales bacterium]
MRTQSTPCTINDCTTCPNADRCPLASFTARFASHASLLVIENDWDRVDEARTKAAAAGIADRVSIHHASVLELLPVAV